MGCNATSGVLDGRALSTLISEAAPPFSEPILFKAFRSEPSSSGPGAPPPRNTSELWDGLKRGLWRITGHGEGDAHCELVLEHASTPWPPARLAVNLELLERVMLGDFQKVVALERAVAYSTVSSMLGQGLRQLGLSCRLRATPLLLVIAAQTRCAERELGIRGMPASSRYVVSLTRPDDALRDRLTQAEYALARLVIEGKSHAEMSRLRSTSPRTVANQIASITTKLQSSGRFGLIARALQACQSPA